MTRNLNCIAVALWFAACLPACIAVDGEKILGKHLAAGNQEFAALDSNSVVGLAPHTGITRVIRSGDLKAIASRFHLTLASDPADLCFMRGANADPGSLTMDKLQDSLAIARGEHVNVEVRSGAAHIRFDASAESNGRTGDTVLVRNPINGRLFQAKVMAKGKVVVQK
jgi:hypothetical protein